MPSNKTALFVPTNAFHLALFLQGYRHIIKDDVVAWVAALGKVRESFAAVLVEEKVGRNARHLEGFQQTAPLVISKAVVVAFDVRIHLIEGLKGRGFARDINEDCPLLDEFGLDLINFYHRTAAGWAPGSPKVDKHYLTFVVGFEFVENSYAT